MELLAQVRAFADGKKTYIVAAVLALLVAVELLLQVDVPGYEPGPNWLDDILAAAGLATLRRGLAKAAE